MGLRKWAIAALAVLVALSSMTPGAAWLGSERVVQLGDIIFGVEYVVQKPSATLFHTESLAATDTEALAIAFPVDASGEVVAPAIGQTVADTVAASESGFFTANWCYTALTNPGGYDLTPDIGTWHPMKSANIVGSGVSWPYMDNAPLNGGSMMTFRPAINTSPDTSNVNLSASAVSPGNITLTGMNQTANQTSSGAASPSVTAVKKPNRDYKNMTKDDIKNMTGLEKMYRNANLRNTVPQTYKGTASRPTTIDPLEKPIDIIKPPDKPKVIKDALAMTKEGSNLKTLFWDL